MADAADLKSASRKRVGVRVPSSAPRQHQSKGLGNCQALQFLFLSLSPLLRHAHYLIHYIHANRLTPCCEELLRNLSRLAVRDHAIINLRYR